MKKGDSVVVVKNDYNDTSSRRLIGKSGVLIKAHTGLLWTVKIDRQDVVLHSNELKLRN